MAKQKMSAVRRENIRLIRKHQALARRGKGIRRARRNPTRNIAWNWIGYGAFFGGGAMLAWDAFSPTKPTAQMMTADAVAGAGTGIFWGGVIGGIMKRSWWTAGVGVVGSIAVEFAAIQLGFKALSGASSTGAGRALLPPRGSMARALLAPGATITETISR